MSDGVTRNHSTRLDKADNLMYVVEAVIEYPEFTRKEALESSLNSCRPYLSNWGTWT